jgi:hypothetical protein
MEASHRLKKEDTTCDAAASLLLDTLNNNDRPRSNNEKKMNICSKETQYAKLNLRLCTPNSSSIPECVARSCTSDYMIDYISPDLVLVTMLREAFQTSPRDLRTM